MTRFPKLPEILQAEIDKIEPSHCGRLSYHPCRVTLLTGNSTDHVYVVAEKPYIALWGLYPEQDRGKFSVRIEDVVSIHESPSRLPAKFANQLYQMGESGMGYQIFTVAFSDGSEQAYLTGNAVDFIEFPQGKGPKDVVAVHPHTGRDLHPLPAPKYYWCLYSE